MQKKSLSGFLPRSRSTSLPGLAPSDGNINFEGGTFGRVRNKGTKFHGGVDLAMPPGTPLYAPYDGAKVIGRRTSFIRNQYQENSFGNYVTLQYTNHPQHGTFSIMFAHLNSVNVTPNTVVNRGQVIGYSGTTGNLGKDLYSSTGQFIKKDLTIYVHTHIFKYRKTGRRKTEKLKTTIESRYL